MVYTELAQKWQYFYVAPAMQQPKSAISTPLPCILKICAIKGWSLIQNHMRHVHSESAREQRIALIKAMNNNVTGNVFPPLPHSGCHLPECNSVSGGVQPVRADPLQ